MTLFDKIPKTLTINTERLLITEIKSKDKENYKNLYLDDELNKWWGYDYREDLGENLPTADYFFSFQKKMKDTKEEYSFAVRLDGKMIGELVLHNFGADDSVEMGFRFFKAVQGKGFAIESATALKDFVFNTLGAKKLKSRCYKENLPSHNLITRLGLEKCREDQTHFYFEFSKK